MLLPVAAVCGGLWAMLKLGSEIREGETGAVDRAVLLFFRHPGRPDLPIGPPWLQETARDITALGGFTVLTIVTVSAIAALVIYGRRRQALVFGGVVAAAQVLAEISKAFENRPRPDLVSHLDLSYSSSFPSGHALMAPVVYFGLAAIVTAGELRRDARRLIVLGSVALVLMIGLSRIYLGVHWPTDVLGGWTLGSAIALAAWTLLRRPGGARPAPP